MMKTVVLAAAVLASAGTAAAQTQPGRWTISVEAGAEGSSSGDLHGGVNAPVVDLGPLNPALSGVSAELRIEPRGFDAIYGEAGSIGAEAAYGLDDNSELFGSLRYAQADEGRVQVGGAFVPALNTTLPVFGTFSDFETIVLETGYRRYFGSGRWRPYAAGRLGAAFTESISATFEIPDAAITIANAPFYESSTSVSAGLDFGVSWALSPTAYLQAETGVRYTSELEGDDSAIGGLGLGSINEVGDRVWIPLTLRARFAF